jgi:hypothetical protein
MFGEKALGVEVEMTIKNRGKPIIEPEIMEIKNF